ncbi:hypothetical protein F5X99DRAFT_25152 [Biscogniauxia marginata]|nr:hypothetical protein F5X99DRAFT_25152 [Biscogniauxia marginata]
MASKTTSIPRFLLPQHGPLWRSTATMSFAARSALKKRDVGQRVLVRYASKTTTTTASTRVAGPRAASTSSWTPSRSPAAKAAKASAPTRPRQPHSEGVPAEAARKKQQQQQGQGQEREQPADPSKPIVLAKPDRFNPPSHGSRLPRSTPRHYGGPATADEVRAQGARDYPGLPPPENTWSHWFINSRGIHLFITLGTLGGLALFTLTASFRAESPFADLIPPISEFPRHPIQYLGVCVDVLRLHEEHVSAQTAEKRRRKADELAKRNEYRRAHGLEPASGIWGIKAEEREQSREQSAVAALETGPDGKRKKFFGIF